MGLGGPLELVYLKAYIVQAEEALADFSVWMNLAIDRKNNKIKRISVLICMVRFLNIQKTAMMLTQSVSSHELMEYRGVRDPTGDNAEGKWMRAC